MSDADEQQPVPGADPTRSAPGVGPGEDPLTVAATRQPASPPTDAVPRSTNAGRGWVAVAVATVLLILLIIFIAENSQSVTISFLGAHGHISLGLAMLIAAVVGALVTLLVGTARIVQLRREVRRHRRAAVEQH